MAAIDVGSAPVDRVGGIGSGYTYIEGHNRADSGLIGKSGKITQVEIYAEGPLTGFKVAIFEPMGGTTFKARSAQLIGDVPAGYSSHVVDLDVKWNDVIGGYHASGAGPSLGDLAPGYNWYNVSGDHTGDQAVYDQDNTRQISIYGTGETVEAGMKGYPPAFSLAVT